MLKNSITCFTFNSKSNAEMEHGYSGPLWHRTEMFVSGKQTHLSPYTCL